ncbi:Endoglucanase [Bienertia sinuspersici]
MARLTLKLIVIFFCAYFCFVEAITRENERLSSQVNYDYKDALSKAILFFEGQRSGKLPRARELNGGEILPYPMETLIMRQRKVWVANVIFNGLIKLAAIEFRSEISSANQLDYLRQAIRRRWKPRS